MTFYRDIDEMFMKADALMEQFDFLGAKQLLEDLLAEEPGYGRAHNHLGWIFLTYLEDFQRAEFHYRLGIRFAPDFPPSYQNYSLLLLRLERVDDLKALTEKAERVPGVKVILFNNMARGFELSGNLEQSRVYYAKALEYSMHEYEVCDFQEHLKRVENKIATKGMFSFWK